MTDEFAAASEDDNYDYEYVDDTSGFDAAPDADLHVAGTSRRSAAAPTNRRPPPPSAPASSRFRKRMLMAMAVLLLVSGVTAYLVSPGFWWLCGTVGAVTILYLGYLRRQTRIEAQVRRRRAQRMMRSHLGVENTNDPEYDVVPARLRRPVGGVGDRRRGSNLRAPGIRPVPHATTTCPERPGSSAVFSGGTGTGSLCFQH